MVTALLVLLCLCFAHILSFEISTLANSCSLCKLAEDLVESDPPVEDLKLLVREQCKLAPAGLEDFCGGFTSHFIDETLSKSAYFQCDQFCKAEDRNLCVQIKDLYRNQDLHRSFYLNTTSSYCSHHENPSKCTHDAYSTLPWIETFLKEAIYQLALFVDPQTSCSLKKAPLTIFEDQPIKCSLCQHFLNWFGECFVEDNRTARGMQSSIHKIVQKVCDLNGVCKLFGCSCEKLADKAINVIRKLNVNDSACVKWDPQCA